MSHGHVDMGPDARSALRREIKQIRRETDPDDVARAWSLLMAVVVYRYADARGVLAPMGVAGASALQSAPDSLRHSLLAMVFRQLRCVLSGVYGDTALSASPAEAGAIFDRLVAVPVAVWGDDTSIGWIHQWWNDADRETLDARLHAGGKVSAEEMAAKSSIYTDRYMVEWLVQNSLGQTWLCICKKNGWRPDAESVLGDLDRRRAAWREKRDKGEVSLEALMPLQSDLEERWKYWLPQPILDDAVAAAPDSVRDLTICDPAVGTGNFPIYAFDLLVTLYREEARHRGEVWTDQQIAEWILERNLHGIDIDIRVTRLAAAALWIKAKALDHRAEPRTMWLDVPPVLPDDDSQIVAEIIRATGLGRDTVGEILDDCREAWRWGALSKSLGEIVRTRLGEGSE